MPIKIEAKVITSKNFVVMPLFSARALGAHTVELPDEGTEKELEEDERGLSNQRGRSDNLCSPSPGGCSGGESSPKIKIQLPEDAVDGEAVANVFHALDQLSRRSCSLVCSSPDDCQASARPIRTPRATTWGAEKA